jgi:hypothetical protein
MRRATREVGGQLNSVDIIVVIGTAMHWLV